jgi:hypothetical protein
MITPRPARRTESPYRSAWIIVGDAGNGEAAAGAGRIGCVVLHRCSVAEEVTWLISVAAVEDF